jgi:hypothetical protein
MQKVLQNTLNRAQDTPYFACNHFYIINLQANEAHASLPYVADNFTQVTLLEREAYKRESPSL